MLLSVDPTREDEQENQGCRTKFIVDPMPFRGIDSIGYRAGVVNQGRGVASVSSMKDGSCGSAEVSPYARSWGLAEYSDYGTRETVSNFDRLRGSQCANMCGTNMSGTILT